MPKVKKGTSKVPFHVPGNPVYDYLFIVLARRLCTDLLEIRKAGKTVLQRDLRIALDQRKQIVDVRLSETVAAGIDPFTRDLAFGVRAGIQIDQLDFTLIVAILVGFAAEANHLVRDAVYCIFNGDASGFEGFGNIGLRGRVRRAALQE